MAIPILPTLPASFHAGDTLKVKFSNGDFPSDEWDLTVTFSGPEQFDAIAAKLDGGDFMLILEGGTTSDRKPGIYSWAALAFQEHERQTIASGSVWIQQNPAEGAATYAEDALTLIEAHIKGRLPAGLSSHTIAGNQIAKISLMDAEKLRDKYRAEVAAERRAAIDAQGGDSSTLHIQFARP